MVKKKRSHSHFLCFWVFLISILALILTVNAATITVYSPNGGEIWNKSVSHTIIWNFTDDPGPNVNIGLFKTDSFLTFIASDVPTGSGGSGSYIWSISPGLVNGSDYQVGVQSVSNISIIDLSDNYFTITDVPSIPPIATFTVNTTAGNAPFAVQFTDTSANTPTAWNWSFRNVTGNNTEVWFSTAQNPAHTFGAGNYSIVLNASNNAGFNLSTQVTFINVTAPALPPVASFTTNATTGTAPLAVTLTDTSANTPTAWNWSFRNVTGNNTEVWFSTAQNPAHTFGAGNYSIVLNASNSAGFNLSTQVTFINITALTALNMSKIGVYRNGVWIIDNNDNFAWDDAVIDKVISFQNRPITLGDMAVSGDWNGDGKPEVGIYDGSGNWYLDYNGNGTFDGPVIDRTAGFGSAGYKPVVGDWDGTGTDKIGVELNGFWAIDYNGNYTWDGAVTDRFAGFGSTGDNPVVGDWDGTGTDKIGTEKDGFWAIDYNGNYTWDGAVTDRFAGFGQTGDIPVVGDWDGTGTDKIGTEKDGFWATDYNGNYTWDGSVTDRFAGFGQTGDIPVVGDWNFDGKVKIGSFKDGFWAIDYNGNYTWDGSVTDRFAGFGQTGDTPVVRNWS